MGRAIWDLVKSLGRVVGAAYWILLVIAATIFAIVGVVEGSVLGHWASGAYHCAAATMGYVLIGFNQLAHDIEREEK